MFSPKHILFIILILELNFVKAQTSKSDTLVIDTTVRNTHSPLKATLMSTVVPGLGQVYNKKYWKVPIVYAGIGTSLYFAISNHNEYSRFRKAYLIRIDSDANSIDEFEGVLTEDNLRKNMDVYRRNRDFSYLIAGLIYVFNIVDAAVDAHLFTFPVNDNLSLNFQPTFFITENNQLNKGFSIRINL